MNTKNSSIITKKVYRSWEYSWFQSLVITLFVSCAALIIGDATHLAHVPYYYMQFLPINALRQEPIQSIWYLHSQLPLENILFAAIVNIFRHSPNVPTYVNDFWKQDSYWIGVLLKQFGFLWLINYSLIRTARTYIGRQSGYISAIIFSLLPSTLMYFLFPYSALMTASLYTALAASVFTITRTKLRLILSVSFISLLGLSHNLLSFYTTFPLLMILVVELFRSPQAKSTIYRAIVCAIALLPFLWMLKNLYLFNISNLTSWSGCALGQSITPLSKTLPSVDSNQQDGWKIALKNIQESADYSPSKTYPTPIVLSQRMKGEGIRNWNHKSVIESCKIAKKYNMHLLSENPRLIGSFMQSSLNRLISTTGNFGSEFNCSGCGFDYKAFGFDSLENIVLKLNQLAFKRPLLRAWHFFLLTACPFLVYIKLRRSRSKTSLVALYPLAFIISNLLVLVMATSLSTIENERMLWMLTPASYVFLLICIPTFLLNRDSRAA